MTARTKGIVILIDILFVLALSYASFKVGEKIGKEQIQNDKTVLEEK